MRQLLKKEQMIWMKCLEEIKVLSILMRFYPNLRELLKVKLKKQEMKKFISKIYKKLLNSMISLLKSVKNIRKSKMKFFNQLRRNKKIK